jgi:hypothetical protein
MDLKICLLLLYFFSTVLSNPLILVSNNHENVIKTRNKNYKPFTIRVRHHSKFKDIDIETSAIILTKDFSDLNELHENAYLDNIFAEKLKFIVVATEHRNDSVPLMFKPLGYYPGHLTHYAYIMKIKPEKIELSTFEFFTKDTCTANQTLLNTFDKKTQTWEQKLKYEEKFMNFNNCKILIGMYDFTTLMAYFSNGELKGFQKDIAEILGQKGNFTPKYYVVKDDETTYQNRTYLLSFAIGSHNIHNLQCCHITKTFKQIQEHFLISQSEAYNSYEKLVMPFDAATWFLLILTFIIAFTVIFCAKKSSQAVRNRIYGRGVNTPAFNVVGTFFGIGQVRLPVESFPRFILMCFILFCLIFRTAYQGVLFDIMSKDMRKPPPKTIEDLYLQNFTILIKSYELESGFSMFNHITELLNQSKRLFD